MKKPTQEADCLILVLYETHMDQKTIKRPKPKSRLFLKIDRDLAAGVYLSEAPLSFLGFCLGW